MVDDQDAVEMVELVLEGPRRLSAEGYGKGHAGDVLCPNLDDLSTWLGLGVSQCVFLSKTSE